jgi:RHS repeat-associated protein
MNPFIKHTNQFDHTLGLKQYECSNHLGNVLAVITDRKHPIDDNNDGTIDYYQPEIVKAVDYSPFGVELYERNFTRTEVTVIDVDEIITIIDEDDFGLSTNAGAYNVGDQGVNWDHTLGTGEVTGQENYLVSSENFVNVIQVLVAEKDWSGLLTTGDDYRISFDIVNLNNTMTMSGPQGFSVFNTPGTKTVDFTAVSTDGSFSLQSGSLGFTPINIIIDNIKLEKIETITETCTVPVGDYRYGFNGMEKDDEVKGQGNHMTTPFRQYDPRIGRWMTRDPIVHVDKSPYMAFNNNPIFFKDPSGLSGSGPDGMNPNEGGDESTPIEKPTQNQELMKTKDDLGKPTSIVKDFNLIEFTVEASKDGEEERRKVNETGPQGSRTAIPFGTKAAYDALPATDPSLISFRLHTPIETPIFDDQRFEQVLWEPQTNPAPGSVPVLTSGGLSSGTNLYLTSPYRGLYLTLQRPESMLIRDPITGNMVRHRRIIMPGNPDDFLVMTVVGGSQATLTSVKVIDASNNLVSTIGVRAGAPTVVTNPITGVSYNIYSVNLTEGEYIMDDGPFNTGRADANGYTPFLWPNATQSSFAVEK